MSGEPVAAVGKDMWARRHFQGLAEFAATWCEAATLIPAEAAVKLPWAFVEVAATRLHSTLAYRRTAV
jgi:hypothetical protein